MGDQRMAKFQNHPETIANGEAVKTIQTELAAPVFD